MNISKKLMGLFAATVATIGIAAIAEPTVTVDKVETGEPWSKVTVNYTLGGTDAKIEYKVAFDVTAGGQTASVTNDAAKLADGAAMKEIDTVALFGKQVSDIQAKVKVTLIAIKPKPVTPPAGQLWADGPIWADCNIGGKVPGDCGNYYIFTDAAAAVTATMGEGWRVPTQSELEALLSNCDSKWETCKDSTGSNIAGYRFTGKDAYSSNSIFLPAAGYSVTEGPGDFGDKGYYWSSDKLNSKYAIHLYFSGSEGYAAATSASFGLSVRTVR